EEVALERFPRSGAQGESNQPASQPRSSLLCPDRTNRHTREPAHDVLCEVRLAKANCTPYSSGLGQQSNTLNQESSGIGYAMTVFLPEKIGLALAAAGDVPESLMNG
ncbi:unnamed protein product, partial [Scytosiphon promiscuus]